MPAADTDLPLQSLTIYLLKDCEDRVDALKTTAGLSRRDLEGVGTLFIRRARPRPPSWARFFRRRIDPSEIGEGGRPDAVLLLTVDDRHFAVTFGSGRFLLDPLKWEQRFGLLVALNTIDEHKVRSVDKQSFDRLASQSRVQASRDASPSEFGLDIERDLLRAVAGAPKDGTPGETIAGLDALNVNARVTLETLGEQLSFYLKRSTEKRYRRAFPWVDQIADVRDPDLRAKLDAELVDLLKTGQTEKCWMAPEHIIDWHSVSLFQFGEARSAPRYTQLTLQAFLDDLDDIESLTPDMLKRRRVIALNADDSHADEWPAMRCLYTEMTLDRKAYVLNAGNWYSIARDFLEEVNAAMSTIAALDLALPTYRDESETAYNKRACEMDGRRFALMDRKLIRYGGGHSQIEFCDLYSDACDMIHLKRYSGSAALSHLFAQAVVAAELFCSEPTFRRDVNKFLARTHRIARPDEKPQTSDFRVVFGIIGGPSTCLELPFFSRVTLKNACRRLAAFGYQIAVSHIPVEERHAKTRSYREKRVKPSTTGRRLNAQ